ncbi:hypothetical protein JRQ81_007590 [Phrynocephalus forsythii]|uniref:Coiled-coil domain-containing protein 157 n=1 Tax=Phrynocephalus forsythii TaxID=171643 RepID=A0A9Q0XCD6_9SAUR|nr:hypothetical protein JRQ81_007590 [Phrynocephalus forsythii]
MATTLVNQNCMESLRKDITDLQGTVLSVFSCIGAVRYPSWKFPDKVSCDLDLVALLEHYDFSENDPEFTQHSHVVFLELVIDRLLLLLQSFTGYTETLLREHSRPPSRATRPCMSIGLAVKRYWATMLELGRLYQQLAAEKQCTEEDASSLKELSQATEAESERAKSSSSEHSESDVTLPSGRSSPLASPASSGQRDGHLAAQSEARSAPGPDASRQSVHTQTMEMSLEPCDGCERAQASLREVGRAIMDICKSQNLPCSLSRFLELAGDALGPKPLTVLDVSYWVSEQGKDLSRISKHLRALVELVNPLKAALEESGKEKEELRKQLEALEGRLQEEKAAQEQGRKEAEALFESKQAESRQVAASLEKENQELRNRVDSLEGEISCSRDTIRTQEVTIQVLEQAKADLLQEMKAKMVDRDQVRNLEDQLQVQARQLESAKQELSWATTELAKERAKAGSMARHKESLQGKQRALIQQLDSLDQQCEQLKASLADGEEEQQRMQERLKEMQEEKWEAQHRLEAQQKLTESAQHEKQSMEQLAADLQKTISKLGELIQEMKEKEKLLVFFPDLHVPVEAQLESTGDVMEDMGKQLQANNIRISVLEEENSRLRMALAKMKEVAQSEGPKLVPPTPLWIRSPSKAGQEDSGRRSPGGCPTGKGFQGAPGRPSPNPSSSGSATRNRAQSGRTLPREGSAAAQRPPGSKLSRPPSGQAPRKPGSLLSWEDAGTSAFARAQGRVQALHHPAHSTWSHQK